MDPIVKEFEKNIATALASLTQEVSSIRTNRPSPSLIEDLKIEYMETTMTLKQLGSISVVPPREIVITLWDPSGAMVVGKAIEDSKRGFTPTVKGASIHINLPPLTQERRDELVKLLKVTTEKTKIRLRSLRDDANKKAELSATEDMKFKTKKKIQELTDKANADMEALLAKKTKEINE